MGEKKNRDARRRAELDKHARKKQSQMERSSGSSAYARKAQARNRPDTSWPSREPEPLPSSAWQPPRHEEPPSYVQEQPQVVRQQLPSGKFARTILIEGKMKFL